MQYIISSLAIFNILIFSKGVPFFVPSWLENVKLVSWLGEKEHLFAKFKCSKNIILLFFVLVMLFKGDLTTFGKNGVSFVTAIPEIIKIVSCIFLRLYWFVLVFVLLVEPCWRILEIHEGHTTTYFSKNCKIN